MAKDSASTRIPRFDTMNAPTSTTRIPIPGSLRIQQTHIVPPAGLLKPTKIISTSVSVPAVATTTKIARPSSLSGIRAPISTIASLKKSLTGEKFTEAATLMSQKTSTVMKKFLTKPEKYEKNIETKAAILEKQEQTERATTNLEKGSKESSNEKLAASQSSLQQQCDKRALLTRSETFVRDCDAECPSNAADDVLYHTYDVHDVDNSDIHNYTCVANSTKICNKTQRYSLFEIPVDLLQSTPRSQNITKLIDKNSSSRYKTQLFSSSNPKCVNSTQVIDVITNDPLLAKTFVKDGHAADQTATISHKKPVLSRSETFSQIPSIDTDDMDIGDRTYLNGCVASDRLGGDDVCDAGMNATLTVAASPEPNESYEDLDATLQNARVSDGNESILNKTLIINSTVTLAPDKRDMKLQLNSTVQNTSKDRRLIDLTISPGNRLINITRGMLDSPQFDLKNQTALLYMSPQTELKHSIVTSRKASSRASLAKTPDDMLEAMDIDQYGNVFEIPTNVKQALSLNALQELKQSTKPRFSFGLDLTESTLDCSIELCDVSLASNAASGSTGLNNPNSCGAGQAAQIGSPGSFLKKQNSFDLDESLGILTPDQMKEFLDSTTTNNTNNLDLPGLIAQHSAGALSNFGGKAGSKLSLHQMRIDLTPSPEDLPLDPVDMKTDLDILMSLPPHSAHNNSCSTQSQSQTYSNSNTITYTELSQTDTDSKTDQMTKSNTSKVSTSFITSVTSITSLDNGYQGDGEMSRPASRGGDHSPSNGPKNKNHISRQPSFNNQHQNIPVRRQDPMTDSDFFTESDADVDIFHRGDRRAQVIDGQLYGPMHQQPAASVFISEQPEMEDSCMESSGIFTDVENRCDDDLALSRRDAIESANKTTDATIVTSSSSNSLIASVTTSVAGETDMSPDGSTDTVKSNRNDVNATGTPNCSTHTSSDRSITPSSLLSQGQCYGGNGAGNSCNMLTDSQTSTINSSLSSDRISVSTDYHTTVFTTTATMTTTAGKRKIHNVRSSPTSNATSPTTIHSKSITEKRAATSPLLNAAKIKALCRSAGKATHNTANDYYCSNDSSSIGESVHTTPTTFKNSSFKSAAHSSGSVKKSSPSRKHVLTASSSVRSSSSLLPSSPSRSPSSYLSNKNKSKNFSNSATKSNSKSGGCGNRKKLSLGLVGNSSSAASSSIECQSPCLVASASAGMVLNQSKPNTINGASCVSKPTKSTVNKRNLSNQENIQHSASRTTNSSNNSSSISLSAGSTHPNNGNQNLILSPQHDNQHQHYRVGKFPPNKWDAVMNKIAENKCNQPKLVKKNYNQVKSKVSTGIAAQSGTAMHSRSSASPTQLNCSGSGKKIISNLLNNSASNSKHHSSASSALNNFKHEIQNGAHCNGNLLQITKSDLSKIKKLINCNGVSGGAGGGGATSSTISSNNSSFDCASAATNTSGLSSPQTKRLVQGAIKRGRSYSKDSQQSSQSDLSLSGGSPKLIIKNSARSAKKRDVRNLSISPTDLGPPPKTQTQPVVTTPNGHVNRTKIISTNSTQKRNSPIHSQTNLTQHIGSKSSPPPKKATPRRILEQKTLAKSPLKDHNRLIGQQQQEKSHQNGNTKTSGGGGSTLNGCINSNRLKDTNSTVLVAAPLTAVCNGNSPTTTTASHGTKLRANGNVNSSANTTAATTPTSNHGSPNNLHKVRKHLQSQSSTGQQQQNKSLHTQNYQNKQQQQQQQRHQQQQQQQQEELHATQNGCKTASSTLDLSVPEGNKSIEALGVLLQYLVYDLDAFACPSIKQDCQVTQKSLLQTQSQLDDARTACLNLQDQLIDKDNFYLTREQDLQTLHRCELTKAETSLIDCQTKSSERIAFLESEVERQREEYNKKIEQLQQQSDAKIEQLEQDLQRARANEISLLKRIEILATNENELRDRIQESEDSFAERLQASVQRERDLSDKIALLTKQLDATRLEAEKRECELEEKLNLSQNELTVIKNNQSFLMNGSGAAVNHDEIKIKSPKILPNNLIGNNGGASSCINSSMSLSLTSGNNSNKVQMLENEVESLRSVMDIKLNDICELRKKNQELTRANEDYEGLKIKYSGMESRLEDLQIQLRGKDEEKQELHSKIKYLQETCAQEIKNRNRVNLHNEELQYRLKQNSEKFNALVAELSKSEHMSCSKASMSLGPDNPELGQNSTQIVNNQTPIRSNGTPIPGLTFEEEEDSPPGSPIIKGVVKKSDSVSWVLQMDEESPEVVASRMVKRAGSFRSSFNEKLHNAKRQLSLPSGPGSHNGSNNSIHSNSTHTHTINPLQQSASATMINSPQSQSTAVLHQRQHSNSESEYSSVSTPRLRSKSVIVKGCDQKKSSFKANSSQSKKIDALASWKDSPICSSSPYAFPASKFQKTCHNSPNKISSLAFNVAKQITKAYSQVDDDEESDGVAGGINKVEAGAIFNRKNSRNLITCNANDRLEIRQSVSTGLPTHAQDLKTLKKSQPQIQESAGEAMVSGTNSEDESCCGSSDDCPSQSQSISSESNSSSSNSSSDHHKQHKLNPASLAMEEALLLDKIVNSLDGTPMEVSWSSDADIFPSESIV